MVSLLGYMVAVSSSLPEVFQLVRTYRLRHTRGLSTLTHSSYLMSWSVWTVYGVQLADGPVVVSSAVGAAVAAATVLAIRRAGTLPSFGRLAVPAVGYSVALALIVASPRLGGLLLAGLDISMFLPQLVAALRQRDLSGLSPLAVAWEMLTSYGWVLYTALRGIPEAGLYSGVYGSMLAVVLFRMVATGSLGLGRPSGRGGPGPDRAGLYPSASDSAGR